jgi:hypothetical protein
VSIVDAGCELVEVSGAIGAAGRRLTHTNLASRARSAPEVSTSRPKDPKTGWSTGTTLHARHEVGMNSRRGAADQQRRRRLMRVPSRGTLP